MKKQRHWLDIAEYASLVGLGVGSVASFVSSQLLYTSAPLSLLVLLNLANRRRFNELTEQNTSLVITDLDSKLSRDINLLNQQVLALPTPEAMGSLKKSLLGKNRDLLEKFSQDITTIRQEIMERINTLDQQNLKTIRQDVSRIDGQYGQLYEAVTSLTGRLNQLSVTGRIEDIEGAIAQMRKEASQLRHNFQALSEQTRPTLTSLQEQINHLNRQFQKLPPPFDSTALKQEVAELIRVVAELVPKRDWNNLVSEVRLLVQEQESRAQSEESLRRKIQELNLQIQTRPVKANLTSLQNQINHLNRQFQKLPPPFDPTSLKREVGQLLKAVANLVPRRDWNALAAQVKALQQQQEFQKQLDETLQQELRNLSQQIETLSTMGISASPRNAHGASLMDEPALRHPQVDFQARIETLLNHELQSINQQLQHLPSEPQLQAQIEETLRRELQDVNQQLRTFPSGPHYELVFDFKSAQHRNGFWAATTNSASRIVLEEALELTQSRLILIWPWTSQCELDDALKQQLEAFLDQGKRLDLGWCHLVSRDEERFLSTINQRWAISALQQGLHNTLQYLLQLKRSYPEQFQFKILGTGENFLVSDQRFAVMGMDEALTATTVFPDLELKLRTDDPEVIQQCIDRFEYPVLHANDLTAYWNRAVTRYDLGDRDGAIADLNHILDSQPNDAIAYNYRGLVRYDQKDLPGGLADFNRSLEINPHQVAAYCNRGFIRSEQNDQLGAISDYSLAIQNQPDSAIAYFYRGLACQKYNDPLAAVTDFSDTIRLMPDSAIAYYYRGQAYQKLENLRGAMADFEIAARLFTERGNKNAQKALKSLAKVKQLLAQQTVGHPTLPQAGQAEPGESAAYVDHTFHPIPVEPLFLLNGSREDSNGTGDFPPAVNTDNPATIATEEPPAFQHEEVKSLENLFHGIDVPNGHLTPPMDMPLPTTADALQPVVIPMVVIVDGGSNEPVPSEPEVDPTHLLEPVMVELNHQEPELDFNPFAVHPTDSSSDADAFANHAVEARVENADPFTDRATDAGLNSDLVADGTFNLITDALVKHNPFEDGIATSDGSEGLTTAPFEASEGAIAPPIQSAQPEYAGLETLSNLFNALEEVPETVTIPESNAARPRMVIVGNPLESETLADFCQRFFE